MSDVEGVRNLVGTGLVDFVGGSLTAVMVFFFLLHRSATVTLTVFSVVGAFVFVLQYGFKDDPTHLPRARQDQCRGHRKIDRVAGRRACSSRAITPRIARLGVFAAGVERLLQNVMKSLTLTSVLGSASTTVLGLVSTLVMWLGGHLVLKNAWTVGSYFHQYNMFLALMVAAGLSDGEHPARS